MSKKTIEDAYEFEVLCPYEKCGIGILFNRNLLNTEIRCPTCGEAVFLCLSKVQSPGISHFSTMKKRALRLWDRKHRDPDKWIECIKEVMREHRQRILNPALYSRYRPS